MNIMGGSQELRDILQSGKGYRNEGISVGEKDLQSIIDYEVNELGNDDILSTCNKFYGTKDVQAVLRKHLGSTEGYAIWVTTFAGVQEHYAEDGETEVTAYQLPGDAVVISDLGSEGVLLAYTGLGDVVEVDTVTIKGTSR